MNKKTEIFIYCVAIIGIVTLGLAIGYDLCGLKTPKIIQWILGVCGTIGFMFGFLFI